MITLFDYLIVLLGFLFGMILTVLVQSYIIEKSKKYEAGFNEAIQFYTKHERGAIYIGFMIGVIFMFILPNIVGTKITWLAYLVERLRIFSSIVGVLSTSLGFWVVKGLHKKLNDFASKIFESKKAASNETDT